MGQLLNLLEEAMDRVTCHNCGWSWNIADGGQDPYTCHKCGTNNTPENEVKCWRGYKKQGTKQLNGKTVNNCVPINEELETEDFCPQCLAEYIEENWNKLEEAEYHGRKVTLGKPFLTPDGPKKRSVYVKNAKGNVVKVNFGQKGVAIKKHLPKHRKSYRARHHCENPGPKWKANYWSCRAW